MKRALSRFLSQAVFGLLFLSVALSATVYADPAEKTIVSRVAEIDGLKLHLSDRRSRHTADPTARLRGDLAHVEADHARAG